MGPTPTAIGLSICDHVIVEERTRKVSLIGTFSGLKVSRFPALAQPFCVFAALTDGEGDVKIELTVTEISTDQELFSVSQSSRFRDRLAETRVLFRLKERIFPNAGDYLFSLYVDYEWVAHRRLSVYLEENIP